jgi:hypothetical protein
MSVALVATACVGYLVYKRMTTEAEKEPEVKGEPEQKFEFSESDSCFSYLSIDAKEVRQMTLGEVTGSVKKNRVLAKTFEVPDGNYRPLIVSGPSGAGKGTLIAQL